MRIASLLPAATEIGFSLGLGGDLMGVPPECDDPPAMKDRPVLRRALPDAQDRTIFRRAPSSKDVPPWMVSP
jgi:hypothetical protein